MRRGRRAWEIPVQPSPYDVWAANEILELFKESDIYRPDVKRAFVINRKIVNTALGRDVTGALAAFQFMVSEVALCQRVIYAESAAHGLSVIEAEPHSEAAKEIAWFAQTILTEKLRRAA